VLCKKLLSDMARKAVEHFPEVAVPLRPPTSGSKPPPFQRILSIYTHFENTNFGNQTVSACIVHLGTIVKCFRNFGQTNQSGERV
jgi:hypothetical protein